MISSLKIVSTDADLKFLVRGLNFIVEVLFSEQDDLGQYAVFEGPQFTSFFVVSNKFVNSTEGLTQCGIEMIFDAIVRPEISRHLPSLENFGDFGPFVAVLVVIFEEKFLFLPAPVVAIDSRVQFIVPPE